MTRHATGVIALFQEHFVKTGAVAPDVARALPQATAECNSLRESGGLIRRFDTAYFMASVDTLEDNKAFAAKEKADFPMLADPEKKVARAYGVIAADAPPERQFARRWTFYIDPAGKIAFIDKAVKPATSRPDIVAKLKELAVPEKK